VILDLVSLRAKKRKSILDIRRANLVNIAATKLPDELEIVQGKQKWEDSLYRMKRKFMFIIFSTAFIRMDKKLQSREALQSLKKLYPTPEELSLLQQENGPNVVWQSAERYMLRLTSIPNFMAKLECWCLKEDYSELENGILEPLMTIKLAIDEILNSNSFKLILSVVLEIGNYLNGGTIAYRTHRLEFWIVTVLLSL
jgi:hypothetical protein